jgi:hypothetical protein
MQHAMLTKGHERNRNMNALNVPSRQSRHISSFRVYTSMLYGSMSATSTPRFLRYFSSILYGCLAPVDGRSSIITTTGPFEASGTAAGVSVEGPMASVSARFKAVGGAGFADDATAVCDGCAVIDSFVWGTVISAGAAEVLVSVEAGAAVVVDAGTASDGGNVLISTGLDDNSSAVFSDRAPTAACCGLLCAAVGGWVAPVEAMTADFSCSHDASSDNDWRVRSERVVLVSWGCK